MRQGLHGADAGRRGDGQIRCRGRQHDRPVEVRQRHALQPPRGLQRIWAFLCRPRPNGTSSMAGPKIEPAFEELIRQAAQGEVVYNDDTTVKILELMGKRAPQGRRSATVARSRHRRNEKGKRKGCSPRGSSPPARATRSPCSSAAAARGREPAGRAAPARRGPGVTDSDVRCLVAESAGGSADDPGPLPGPWPAAVRRRGRGRFPDECRYVLETLRSSTTTMP